MKFQKLFHRLASFFLCLAILASLMVLPASAAEEAVADTAAETSEQPLDVLWMGSDFQKNATDTQTCTAASTAAMQAIVDAMVASGVNNVSGAIFLGDYAPGYYSLNNTNLGIQSIRLVLNQTWGIDYEDIFFMQGNHEADYQKYWDNGYDPNYYTVVSDIYNLASSGKHDRENYGVYIINEIDYSWDNIGGVEKVTKTAAALESYLKTKVNRSYDKPIFITAHLPLNFSERTIHSGDAFTGELLFNVINKYAAQGLNIIYLYGHDHNHGFSNYLGGDAIYLSKGDTMLLADTDDAGRNTYYTSAPMHFTYLNAGFLGEINGCCADAKTGVSNQNTSTILKIYEDRVEITRYDSNGVYNAKNAGSNSQCSCSSGIYCDETYAPNTTVLSGTQTVTLNKAAYSLELGELSSGLMVAGETAKVNLEVQDGNTYDVSWVSSNEDIVSVSGSGTEALVTAIAPGSVVITVTPTLATVRSADQLTFQITVISDMQNPGELVTVVTQGEAIYMRQPYQWDHPFVYDAYPYFFTADDNPFILVREALGYTETDGSRYILGQTDAYSNNVYPWNNEGISTQVMAYSFSDFEHPFIKVSSVPSNRYKWNIAKVETGIVGFGTPFTIRNAESGNYIYLTAGDAEQYMQDSYGFRFKGDPVVDAEGKNGEYGGTWWRMASGNEGYYGTGLLGAKGTADSHTLYTLYYSSSLNHFAVTTHTSPSSRIYLYHQTTAPVTVTLQVSDTMGYICKDSPKSVPTGDYIILTEGNRVTEIPVTVEMLEGYADHNTSGTYSDLKLSYQGVTLTEDYTLIVRDSASLMVNDGSDTSTSSIYRLATGITEGKKYMIVNSNQPGQAQALGFVAKNDGSDISETETESYYVVVEEWTIDGVTDLYVDASNFNGVDHISGHRMAWFAQKNFSYTTTDGVATTKTSLDGYYYFVSVNSSEYALMNGRYVTSTIEPYNYRWGEDYDLYGLYNNYESNLNGDSRYLNYDAGLLEINKFTVREASTVNRVYLFEQIPTFALAAGYMSDLEGEVTIDAIGSTITGDALIIETMTVDGTVNLTAIPVSISMLNATKEQITTPGTYHNLTVTYHGQVITDDYTLVVEDIVLDDYPPYPEEGSVRIDKTLDESKYNYLSTGAASIDLSVTGVPQFSGADVVIVLDTSSSMAFGIDGEEASVGKSRLELLQESLKKLMLNLKTDVNGEPRDISISIVDFNGYTPIDNTHTPHQFSYTNVNGREAISGYSPTSFGNRDLSEVYLPFTDINDMSEADIDSVLSQIICKSGTNYDRGLQWAYDLLYEKQAQNSLNGENRRPYVVFMSDGSPWQYNYIMSDSDGIFWEDYLMGRLEEAVAGQTEASQEPHFMAAGVTYSSVEEMFSESAADVWEDFYNPDGKHWMAEAIKGDPNTKYKIIDPDIGNVDNDFVTEVNGLGATMVTIGLGIYYSGEMEEDDCKQVLRNIATTPENYYDILNAEDLDNAFSDFASLVATADGAVYTDQMSEEFEVLTYNQRTFEKIDGSSVTVTYNPQITLRQYPLYLHSEIGKTLSFADSEGQVTEVLVTEDMVGQRKPEDSILLETVIFNDDGTAAYSTHVDMNGNGIYGAVINEDGSCTLADAEDNILVDNVICAKNFWYNTHATESRTIDVVTSDVAHPVATELTAKTFWWKVGIIPQNELILTYDIYLTGSMEGTCPAGYCDTNAHAELNYVNYLDHSCRLVAPVPQLLWGQATVGYGFYVVNGNGEPVTDLNTYAVGNFEDAVKVDDPSYFLFLLNAEEQNIVASEKFTEQGLANCGYILFDPGAAYSVSAASEGSGYYTVTTKEENQLLTTYVVGVEDTAVKSSGTTATENFASANTVVWFAVLCLPDAGTDTGLAVDKTVTATEDANEFVLTLEAYAVGQEITLTRPADIVLVLDHSGSMRTPVGAPDVLESGTLYSGEGAMTYDKLDPTLGQHTGYYVAQSQSSKTWFVVRYDAETAKWFLYSVPNTEAIVNIQYESAQQAATVNGWTEHTKTQSWTAADIAAGTQSAQAFIALKFYKSQYAVLYDAVKEFVADLKATGVEHRIAIVGFAGSTGNGSCVYVGVDETPIKSYNAIYHVNTTAERRTELYQKALKNIQDAEDYSFLLDSIEAIETNYSYTCPASGLQMASDLFAANEVDLSQRDRIVVLFTDGVPNAMIGEERGTELTDEKVLQIRNEIVSTANTAKQQGAQIYSVSTTTLGAGADRTFLSYASSDYPNATDYTNPGTVIASPKFTNEIASAAALGNIFDQITQNTISTHVELNDAAILREVLSDYFDLDNLDGREIEVYTAAYDGSGDFSDGSNYGTWVEFTGATVLISPENGRKTTIDVVGFNYQTEYLSVKSRTVNGEAYYGSKLIVQVPIRTREGFWGGNNVPTNEDSTAVYTSNDGITPHKPVEYFPMPEANVPITVTLEVVDKTIYYNNSIDSDGDSNEGDELISKVIIGGKEVTPTDDGRFLPKESWMADYANASWDEYSTKPDSDLSNTEPKDYTYTVTVTPNSDGTQNKSSNPSNIAGNTDGGDISPEDLTAPAKSAEDTGHVFVLVPELTFKDSSTDYGTPTDGYDYEAKDYVDTQWVYMEDTKDTANAPEVSGDEPDLTLIYAPDETATPDGSFVTDTKVEVTVTMGNGQIITDVVIFGWQDNCTSVDHLDDMDLGVHSGTADSNEFWVHVLLQIRPDTVVVDFGLPIEIHVLVNDDFGDSGELVAIGAVPERMDTTAELPEGFLVTHSGSHGTAEIRSDAVIYTPAAMTMDGEDTFCYVVKHTKNERVTYYYSTVTVVPAAAIYYEDDFVDFTGTWEIAGKYQGGNQGEDRPGEFAFPDYDMGNVYGYDPAYDASTTYSLGSSRHTHVSSATYEQSGAWPTATFTFTGTGFDLISLTSNQTGFITCRVYEGTQTETIFESWVVDTYYGYARIIDAAYPWVECTWTYNGERWTGVKTCVAEKTKEETAELPANPQKGDVYIQYKENYIWTPATGTNDLYQIPVIKSPVLDYGTYTVVVTPTYIPFFDHTGTGGYDFYLDAVRIYAPAENMESYYLPDGEAYPQYVELRKNLLTTDESGNATGYVNGISFIDGVSDGLISDYENYGPNNEIYLNSNQAVAFAIDSNGQTIANVHVGLKIFNGAGSLTATALNAAGETLSEEIISTTSHTDLYYSISSAYLPVEGSDVSNVIVLTNSGDSPITLTTLKLTYAAEPTAEAELVMDLEKMQAAGSYVERKASLSLPVSKTLKLSMGHSVNFESDLQMNYRIKLTELEGFDLSTASLVVEKDVYPAKGEPTVETFVLTPELSSDRMIFTLAGIHAAEMGSELRATLHISDAQGREVSSSVDTYSILAYAQLCFDTYTYEAEPSLYRLLMDTLNYGAAAQSYFGRRMDCLVNAGMEAYRQYASTELAEELTAAKVTTGSAAAVSKIGFSVSFTDRTELNAKLSLTNEATEITCVKVTDESGNLLATLTDFTRLPDGRLQVSYEGIKATQLRQMYYFTAYAGEEIASPTCGYSVEAYARSCMNGTDLALIQLVRSCMYYGDSAANYFAQRGAESN